MKYKFFIASFLFVSCKKNEISKTELLTDSSWVYQDAKLNGVSIFSTIPGCLRDNLFFYKKNGELTVDDGPTKCNATSPQTENLPWYFFSNDDSISINGVRNKIIELSKTQFITEVTTSANDKFLYIHGK